MIHSAQVIDGYARDLEGVGSKVFEFSDKLNVLFGPNGCLAEGTLVLTDKGPIPIEDIKIGDIVYDENGNPITVLKTFYTGEKTVVELKNRYSVLAECTYDHVWLCKNKNDHKFRGIMVNDFHKTRNKIKKTYPKAPLGSIDYPYSYAIAASLGDGCCCQSTKYIQISSNDECVIKKVSDIYNTSYKKLHSQNYTWEIYARTIPELYESWCKNKKAHEKIVDFETIKTWNRKTLLEFTAGLIDTDGSVYKRGQAIVIRFTSQSKSIINAAKYCFLSLWGIEIDEYIDDRKKYKNGNCYSISIGNNVDSLRVLLELSPHLAIDRKKYKPEYGNIENISKRTGKNHTTVRLGNSRITKTYDIHVDSLTNFYCLANGLITHNCGKSSILKIIKAYCGIRQGGWSQISQETALAASRKEHFPYAYSHFSPGNCKANVTWDGTPSFYNEGDVKADNFAFFFSNERMSEDGITTGDDYMDAMALKPSSGQYRLQKLNKIMNILDKPPLLTGYTPEAQYIQTLPRNGKVTILLDEPERALSLPKQLELFKILEEMSDKYQIIIATHSPFVLFNLESKIFDMETGYSEKCIGIFKDCVKDYLTRKLLS